MHKTTEGQGYTEGRDGTWQSTPRGPAPSGVLPPVVPTGGLLNLDDDRPLAPVCPMRPEDGTPCESCQ